MVAETGVELAPIPLSHDDPLIDRVRAIVSRNRRHVQAAFLYLRAPAGSPAEALRPTIGLLPVGHLSDPSGVARQFLAAAGVIYGRQPLVVALHGSTLPAALEVAPPIGAGGQLEDAVADAVRGGRPERVIAAATFVDSIVTVPVSAEFAGEARELRPGDAPAFAVVTGDDGKRFVTAFSSDLALAFTKPPTRAAVHMPGAVVAAAAPADTDIMVDPGLPAPYPLSTALLRELAGYKPRR